MVNINISLDSLTQVRHRNMGKPIFSIINTIDSIPFSIVHPIERNPLFLGSYGSQDSFYPQKIRSWELNIHSWINRKGSLLLNQDITCNQIGAHFLCPMQVLPRKDSPYLLLLVGERHRGAGHIRSIP